MGWWDNPLFSWTSPLSQISVLRSGWKRSSVLCRTTWCRYNRKRTVLLAACEQRHMAFQTHRLRGWMDGWMDERVKRLEKCHPANRGRLECFVPLMDHRYGHFSPFVFLYLILTITEECERRAGQSGACFTQNWMFPDNWYLFSGWENRI